MIRRLLFVLALLLTCSVARAQQQNFPGSGSGSTPSPAPKMAFYFSSDCSAVVNAYCQNTFADTQQTNACAWTNASTTVTCLAQVLDVSGAVAANVATYSFYTVIPANWVAGDSITIAGFTGADTFLNQTCTVSTVTSLIGGSTITCPLVHANGSSTTFASIVNNNTARGPFVAGDVGKTAMGFQTCVSDSSSANMAAGAITTTTALTIAGFTNSTAITLSGTPAATATLTTTFPSGGCFIWGHLDDTGAAALDLVMQNSTQCPKLFLAAASYLFASPHFYNNPPACQQNAPGIIGTNSGGFGNTTLPAGMEIEGRGAGNTAWFLTPSFPGGDSCAHTATPIVAPSGTGCFVIPVMGKWKDFRIDGGGQATAANLNSKTLIYASVATLESFTCVNMGAYNASNMVGIGLSYLNQLYQVNNAGCGAIGIKIDALALHNIGYRVIVENSATFNLLLNGAPAATTPAYETFTCYFCYFAGAATMNATAVVQNLGGVLKLFGGIIQPAPNTTSGNNTVTGYKAQTNNGSVLYADGLAIDMSIAGATNNGIFCSSVTCTNYLVNTNIKATNAAYFDAAGSKLYDGCGNTFSGTNTIAGSVYGSCSITGTTQTSGNWSVPAGAGAGQWGTSPSVGTCSGNALVQQCTITVGSGTVGASPVLTITIPSPTFLVAPSCDARMIGGSATFQNFITGTVTTSSVPLTYNGTPAASSTIILKVSCSN